MLRRPDSASEISRALQTTLSDEFPRLDVAFPESSMEISRSVPDSGLYFAFVSTAKIIALLAGCGCANLLSSDLFSADSEFVFDSLNSNIAASWLPFVGVTQ
jgi:hypothetical protein